MSFEGDSIYSPETSDQALVQARRDHQQLMVAFANEMRLRQNALDREKRELESARALVRIEENKNWTENQRVQAEKAVLENDLATVKRDKELVAKRENQVRALEEKRRRNRTNSESFIEDSFSILSPRDVVSHLTNSSLKIRKHAMSNISACLGGFKECPPSFVRFTPQDIAPHILPIFHTLLSTSKDPLEGVVRFTEEVVSAPSVAKALALSGQCNVLADYLIETNTFTSQMAICSFRRMAGMETSVVKPAYEALSRVIPQIPISELNQPPHPAVEFVKEVAPKIIEDCFNNGLWSAIAPLVSHRITPIREIVLHKVKLLTLHSDRNQHGLVEVHVLGFLDQYYALPSPPPDIVDFFVDVLPLVAERLCRQPTRIHWLLMRLSDANTRINTAVISAFQMGVVKQDPTILQMFVKVDLLKKLNEPPTQQSFSISKLMCQMLPVLAIPYARVKSAEGIVTFLDHSETSVAHACLLACIRIVESTIEDRTHLFSVISKLNFSKASTLKLYDHAMPVFCKDWATSGDFKTIVGFLQHSEPRVRHPAQKVWCDIVCNSPSFHSKIVRDGLLDDIFELCTSQYDDALTTGAKCCIPLAIEITKAGVDPTRQLVELLCHPRQLLRESALRAVQVAAESTDASCQVLLEAEAFKSLQLFFETYPKDLPENARKILTRLAPFLLTSSEACTGLLQLLESSSSLIEHAARSALTTISNSSMDGRQILRTVVLNRLLLPTEALIEYATKAIQDWIGPDLAQLNDFTTFFSLISHSDKRIQTAALISLRQKMSNLDNQESLEQANVVMMIRTLSDSDNPEAFNFIMEALRVLASSLARNGHTSTLINLLMHKEPKVREGAAAALEVIANGSEPERKKLLEEAIIERLIGHEARLEQTPLHLLCSIIPKLVIDYLNAGRMELILTLVDHQQQQIRAAATKAVETIASGTPEQKAWLRDALFPRLDKASPLLRQVAAGCFSRTLAHDLVVDGDFIRLFRLFQSEDIRIRQPIIKELQAHIQRSDEAGRRSIVETDILPAILEAYAASATKDDLVRFLSTCVLPVLGPAFTQNDGGSSLFPLLTHEEPRIRAAAIQGLKNSIDSRHGNMVNMAKAYVVETLHPLMGTDDAIRDLWCRILPKIAPFLASRSEIDKLFESLSDNRESVREAASDALTIMAKTSDGTRGHMFPALLHSLENHSPESLPLIAKAISLSGSTFIVHNKETELFHLILKGEPEIAAAAIEATTQLLAKGSPFEHQKLLKADVFSVALGLHDRRSQRQNSLDLLRAIISHLSYALLIYDDFAKDMCSLFDDPDLAITLYQTWSDDERVYENLPELLPLLLENNRVRNPCVAALLRQVGPSMVTQLVSRRRLDVIVKALRVADSNIVHAFLRATCVEIENSNEREKNFFVTEPSFVSVIGMNLQGRDATLRRDSSTIVQLLSKGSPSRSGTIMNEGIGQYLSWVAVHGEKGAQQSSLDALYSLFMAAPNHADRLVADSLKALCHILDKEGQVVGVYSNALRLLVQIVKQSSHSPVIESGIVDDLVRWLSLQHSVTATECRSLVFDICLEIAQQSDDGRKALVDAGVLLELSYLATSQIATEVVSACKIIKALAHTGTFANVIISAGLKNAMESITSPFRKSTLQSKEDKQRAQASAKEVLQILKLAKRQSTINLAQANTSPRMQQRTSSFSSIPQSNSDSQVPEVEPRPLQRVSLRNIPDTPESDISPDLGSPTFDGPPEPLIVRPSRHSRSLSDIMPTPSRSEGLRLSAVHEDEAPTLQEEGYLRSPAIRPRQSTTTFPDIRQWQASNPSPHSTVGEVNSVTNPDDYRTTPPLYRTKPSISRSGNRLSQYSDDPQDFKSTTPVEENPKLRKAASTSSTTAPPSYKLMSSVLGSVRRG